MHPLSRPSLSTSDRYSLSSSFRHVLISYFLVVLGGFRQGAVSWVFIASLWAADGNVPLDPVGTAGCQVGQEIRISPPWIQ